jgi:hypothetical protein
MLRQLRGRFSPSSLVTAAVVAASSVFVFVQLSPSLLFADTTPAGGDMGAHVWMPAYLRDHLLPHWRLTGWAPDWYAGFPALQFYFPLPILAIVVADLVLPYGIAFKLVSVAGLVGLPVAAWAFGKLAGMRAPAPACLAAATLPFLFNRGYTIYGGNIPSTLAGEFAFAISLCVGLVFLGLLFKALDEGRYRGLAAVLLAVCGLCHVLPAFFVVVGAVVIVLMQPSRQRFVRAVPIAVVGALLAAFWVLPFVLRLEFTTDMGWERLTTFRKELLRPELRWLTVMAAAGGMASLLLRRRAGTFLVIMATASALGFRFLPQGKIWNARLLPFWFLCLFLLAGVAVAEGSRGLAWLLRDFDRRARSVAVNAGAVVAALAALIYVGFPLHVLPGGTTNPDGSYSWAGMTTTDHSFIPGWARWNYSGYERKDAYPEYRNIIATMTSVGRQYGCGRAHWEYEAELDQHGTPMALMLLPFWTNGCIASMEGLYFESSATTPYHFLSASEVSKRPSRPQRDLPYRDLDLSYGVEHLQLLGVKYYMSFSEEAKAQARQHPDLSLVATVGPYPVVYNENNASVSRDRVWEIYEVDDSAVVAPLEYLPAVVSDLESGGPAWQDLGVKFWQDAALWDVPLAADGPDSWPRVSADAKSSPRRAVPAATVSRIRESDDRISFDVDRVGTPVLVKASYFPNWKASGAEGPWRVTPNQMVVVPTSRHVELHYGYTGVDLGAMALTFLGLLGLVGVFLVDRNWPTVSRAIVGAWPRLPLAAPPPPRRALVSAALAPERDTEVGQAAYGADPPPHDRGARRSLFDDADGDLDDGEPGPLGAEDELGVEQVGAEPAALDDR